MKVTDFKITGHGTIYLIHPKTPEARGWLDTHSPDDAAWFCYRLVIEQDYIHLWVTEIQKACRAVA